MGGIRLWLFTADRLADLGLAGGPYFSDKLIGFVRYNGVPSHEKVDSGFSPLTATFPLTPLQLSAGSGMLTGGITESVNPALVNDARVNLSWQAVSIWSQFLSLNGAKPFPANLLFLPGYSPQNSQVSLVDFSDPSIPPLTSDWAR
jgi:hypothetical protein